MDTGFWLGIICGALVGIPFSIAANLWTDPIRDFLLKRHTLRLNSQKSEELTRHTLARGLFDGDMRAVLSVQADQTFSLRIQLYGIYFSVLMVAVVVITLRQEQLVLRNIGIGFTGFLGVLSLVIVHLSNVISRGARELIAKASNLEEYEDEIRAKWGPDALG